MPLEATKMPVDEFKSETGEIIPLTPQNASVLNYEALKAYYLKVGDPTEYRFAQIGFPGGWSEWSKLIETNEFKPVIGEWRAELAAKLRSDALARILEAAQGEGKDSLGANKYIYEALDREESKQKVGRPSKEHIKQEAERLFEENRIKDEAYQRILNAQAQDSFQTETILKED